MKKLSNLIKEEFFRFLKEYYDDEEYSIAERYYNLKDKLTEAIFDDFLYHNNADFTKHIRWTVIPFARLKKIWEDYMTKGFVRDEKGMRMISGIMIRNTIRVEIFTELFGHTVADPTDDYDTWIGTFVDDQLACIFEKYPDLEQLEIPFDNPAADNVKKTNNSPCRVQIHPYIKSFVEELIDDNNNEISEQEIRKEVYELLSERFADNYAWDTEGKLGGFISDYGLRPLQELVSDLMRADTAEKELVIVDKMLNVVHMRSDIASWFVQGGSTALSSLSGYIGDENNNNISGQQQIHQPM